MGTCQSKRRFNAEHSLAQAVPQASSAEADRKTLTPSCGFQWPNDDHDHPCMSIWVELSLQQLDDALLRCKRYSFCCIDSAEQSRLRHRIDLNALYHVVRRHSIIGSLQAVYIIACEKHEHLARGMHLHAYVPTVFCCLHPCGAECFEHEQVMPYPGHTLAYKRSKWCKCKNASCFLVTTKPHANFFPSLPPRINMRAHQFDVRLMLLQTCPGGCVLCIQGGPGVGKTTDALVLGHDPCVRAAFSSGMYWLEADTCHSEYELLERFAKLLGMSLPRQNYRLSCDNDVAAIRAYIGKQRILIVIDELCCNTHLLPFTKLSELPGRTAFPQPRTPV